MATCKKADLTMPITEEALSNPLILRLILLHLPFKDLLLAQRVCQEWRRLVKKSNSLQQALFFVPDESPIKDGKVLPNELLMERFPGFYMGGTGLGPRTCFTPLLSTDLHRLSRTEGFARPEASWRYMLPCQPAPTELQVVEALIGRGGKQGTVKTLRFDKNLNSERAHFTFGLMYELVQAFLLPSFTTRPGVAASTEMIGFAYPKEDAWPADEEERKQFLIRWKSWKAYRQRDLNSMRRALTEINFAGEGCVVVWLSRMRQCCVRERILPDHTWYSADWLKSEASIVGDGKSIEWDLEKRFFVR
ncbi:hypothetical protein AC578_3936 [Pseudocercospora eumusae]|uniref:F-box domain-containing protein n=1 Tax=Pseudocercospora eumusae TaxID=321146 RepID=A0A139GXL3_9PEZI|nr:hypothetical protein AC578_3936 [Pseudocercospora eumusae]